MSLFSRNRRKHRCNHEGLTNRKIYFLKFMQKTVYTFSQYKECWTYLRQQNTQITPVFTSNKWNFYLKQILGFTINSSEVDDSMVQLTQANNKFSEIGASRTKQDYKDCEKYLSWFEERNPFLVPGTDLYALSSGLVSVNGKDKVNWSLFTGSQTWLTLVG